MPFYKVTQRPQYFASRYLIESETGVVLCGSESIDYANHVAAALNAYTPPPVCQHDLDKDKCTVRATGTYGDTFTSVSFFYTKCTVCGKEWTIKEC